MRALRFFNLREKIAVLMLNQLIFLFSPHIKGVRELEISGSSFGDVLARAG
jgi:hypothetical protein